MVAVVGATASGKTDLSLDLAQRLGGEIVNTDAMQLYRGMDIGTAKLPEAERRGIPHHLLDVLDIHETASVAEFQRMARAVIDDLRGRGVVPVLVGGSALYTRAVLDRFEFPGTDAAVRRELEDALAADGPAVLHARLAGVDPQAAAGILPTNGRRIVRALEVVTITGQPVQRVAAAAWSTLWRTPTRSASRSTGRTLEERIARRVAAMFDGGFVAEVEALVARGLADSRTASRAIGYPEVMATAGRRAHRGRGSGTHRGRDPALRPAPGLVVPQGPADHLGQVGRRGPDVTEPSGRYAARRVTEMRVGAWEAPRRRLDAVSGYCTTPRAFTMPAP